MTDIHGQTVRAQRELFELRYALCDLLGIHWIHGPDLPTLLRREIEALTAERDLFAVWLAEEIERGGRFAEEIARLRTQVDHWREKFCPTGRHYKGATIQSRLNPETGKLERATRDTYRCWACDREKRQAECPHDGDIAQHKMAAGYGWECSRCCKYFGHIDIQHKEALALIREELAATHKKPTAPPPQDLT